MPATVNTSRSSPGSFTDIGALPSMTGATVAPPAVQSTTGSAGSAVEYARADHTHASPVQKTVLTTDASGNVTWTFARPFTDTDYAVAALAQGTGITISITSKSMTAITFNARLARALPSVLLNLNALLNFDIFANPASNVKIDAFAGKVTQ